jgi:oxysterol-binding protein 1
LKGYQKRWFVLRTGILSYYRSQDDIKHTCRGTIYLESARLSSNDACNFVITNGSTVLHLRTSNETDKQRWMSAIELAKQKAVKVRKHYQDSDEDVSTVDDINEHVHMISSMNVQEATTNTIDATKLANTTGDRVELVTMNKTFDSKLEDLKMCMDLINRHYQALHRTLADLEQMDKSDSTIAIVKSVNERATLFRITSTGNRTIFVNDDVRR